LRAYYTRWILEDSPTIPRLFPDFERSRPSRDVMAFSKSLDNSTVLEREHLHRTPAPLCFGDFVRFGAVQV